VHHLLTADQVEPSAGYHKENTMFLTWFQNQLKGAVPLERILDKFAKWFTYHGHRLEGDPPLPEVQEQVLKDVGMEWTQQKPAAAEAFAAHYADSKMAKEFPLLAGTKYEPIMYDMDEDPYATSCIAKIKQVAAAARVRRTAGQAAGASGVRKSPIKRKKVQYT
jgi:hypothetical protein